MTPFGRFMYRKIPFGLTSAQEMFQRTISDLIREINTIGIIGHADDITVSWKTLEEHDKHLFNMLTKLREMGPTLNKNKCKFRKTKTKYLGFWITSDGINIDPGRTKAIISTAAESTTPTIILLPYGRMLVVDRSMFTQLQADNTGIDFMELSANMIRAQRYQTGSTPSILDSEANSKGYSPTSLGFSPPAYEDIFGDKNSDLPPSYSEVSLMLRSFNRHISSNSVNTINFRNHNNGCNGVIVNRDTFSDIDVNNDNNINKELDETICDASVHININEQEYYNRLGPRSNFENTISTSEDLHENNYIRETTM